MRGHRRRSASAIRQLLSDIASRFRLSRIEAPGATIAFEVVDDTVNILGVYYGGQDYETDLRDDG